MGNKYTITWTGHFSQDLPPFDAHLKVCRHGVYKRILLSYEALIRSCLRVIIRDIKSQNMSVWGSFIYYKCLLVMIIYVRRSYIEVEDK